MRTTIVIDDALFREAVHATAIRKKRHLVEAGLRELIRKRDIERLIGSFGRVRMSLTQRGLRRLRGDR